MEHSLSKRKKGWLHPIPQALLAVPDPRHEAKEMPGPLGPGMDLDSRPTAQPGSCGAGPALLWHVGVVMGELKCLPGPFLPAVKGREL